MKLYMYIDFGSQFHPFNVIAFSRTPMLNILLLVSFIQFVLFLFSLPLLYFSLPLSFYNFTRVVFPADFFVLLYFVRLCVCELIFNNAIFTHLSFFAHSKFMKRYSASVCTNLSNF